MSLIYVQFDTLTTIAEELKPEEQVTRDKYKTVEEEDPKELEIAWDDVFGAALDPKKVREARKEELEYVHKM